MKKIAANLRMKWIPLALAVTLGSSLRADDFNFSLTSGTPFNGTVKAYDANGLETGVSQYADMYQVDSDNDGNVDYYQSDFILSGLPAGEYSLHFYVYGDYDAYSELMSFPALNGSGFDVSLFSAQEPPVRENGDDLPVNGNLDVLGNLMNFGTNASPSHGEPGVQITFNPSLNEFSSYMPSYLDYRGSNHAKMTWSFAPLAPGGAPSKMEFRSDGSLHLTETEGIGASIYVNGYAAQIYVRGYPVLTSQSLQTPQMNSLRIGSVTVPGSASLAGGLGSKVYGNNSLAFGAGATVGATLVSAHNAVALGASSLATKEGAMAFGKGAKALQNQSIAIGQDAEASGTTQLWWSSAYGLPANYDWGSIALGTKARAVGIASSAFGPSAQANGDVSVAIGPRSNAWPGADGSIAIGYEAVSWGTQSIAVGPAANAEATMSVALGNAVYAHAPHSSVLGQYSEAVSLGQVVVGVAPDLGLSSSTNWDDMDAEVFVVGAGKPGPWIGPVGWGLENYALTKRTALSVKRSGELTATGTVNSDETGPGKYNKFKAPILVPESGDISMGEFDAGERP